MKQKNLELIDCRTGSGDMSYWEYAVLSQCAGDLDLWQSDS
jgi:hypothetical protein